MLNEIVADKQRQVVLRFSNQEVVQLPLCMDIPDAVHKLAALTDAGKCQLVGAHPSWIYLLVQNLFLHLPRCAICFVC